MISISNMPGPHSNQTYTLLESSFHETPLLKTHKALPRRRNDFRSIFPAAVPVKVAASFTDDETSAQLSTHDLTPLASPSLLKSADSGLPPTPPSNSLDHAPRVEFSPPPFADGVMSSLISKKPSLSTPINQRSPPTPGPSPPRTTDSLATPERTLPSTYPSSRAESFKTAREEQWSSDAGDSRIHLPLSDAPVLGSSGSSRLGRADDRGLGLAFEIDDGDSTPTARTPHGHTTAKTPTENDEEDDNGSFNVDYVPNREWDTNLMRYVTVRRKRRPKTSPKQKLDLLDTTSSGTGSTIRRGTSLRERVNVSKNSPRTPSMEKFAHEIGWPNEVNDILNSHLRDADPKRLSGVSTASTVVEAVVIITPPQRHRTLRHTGKNLALRRDGDSPTERSPVTRSNRNSVTSDDVPLHRLVHKRSRIPDRKNRYSGDSDISVMDTASAPTSSPRQLRETIPVAVFPHEKETRVLQPAAEILRKELTQAHSLPRTHRKDIYGHKRILSAPEATRDIRLSQPTRKSTLQSQIPETPDKETGVKSPIEPTANSAPRIETTSPSPTSPTLRRTRRVSENLTTPLNTCKELPALPITPPLENTLRRAVASESKEEENSEQRKSYSERVPTIKEPHPPARSNSENRRLSSNIGGSSISQEDHLHPLDRSTIEELPRVSFDGSSLHPDDHRRMSFDRSTVRTEEHAMARHLYAPSTPFSQFSDTPDALEVSEATAVSIYPHNNHSLLVVQQVARSNTLSYTPHELTDSPLNFPSSPPSVGTELLQSQQPTLTFEPSTPPLQSILPVPGTVDSPLKNPRKPPIPPAFKIIPPTPMEELDRQLAPGPPPQSTARPVRRLSLVQRARRYSDTFITPLLARVPSTRTRVIGGGGGGSSSGAAHETRRVPSVTEDDSNLHPFWRPRGFWEGFEDSDPESEDGEAGAPPLPLGGDTSDVEVRESPAAVAALGALGRRLTNSFKGSGGFLIGNSLGVERSGSNRRRPHVAVPAAMLASAAPSRVEKRSSRGSLRSSGSLERGREGRKEGRREGWRKGKSIPGFGMQVQYIGLSGMKEKFQERRRRKWERSVEKRREALKQSIGPTYSVEGVRVV
jgi:hypothetical protein